MGTEDPRLHLIKSLNVPLIHQEYNYDYVPACVKMMIEYLNKEILSIKIPDMTLKQIGKIIDTRSDGTYPHSIEKINKAILGAVPSVEFESKYAPHTFEKIVQEYAKKRPVIAWIRISKSDGDFTHVVVVNGINKDEYLIQYQDPKFGTKVESIGDFITKWSAENRVLAKLILGRRNHKVLTAWQGRGSP